MKGSVRCCTAVTNSHLAAWMYIRKTLVTNVQFYSFKLQIFYLSVTKQLGLLQ
jgi:hypothetical protein